MNCPVDNTQLVMSERSGIEIDYCPQCRGVWLDRGELDKIIERSAAIERPQERREEPRYEAERPRSPEPRYEDRDYRHQKPRKRESFLGELFDF